MQSKNIKFREFTALMAVLMSIVALSIDTILPALGQIGQHFAIQNENHVQWVIVGIFAGMTIGESIAGPLSDAIGRKPILFMGIIIYLVGTSLCYFASSFEWFLIGRFVQGLGVAGPHIAAIAIVRDNYSGEQMARIMSLVMMIFMAVPAIAPSIGQVIIHFFRWQEIFILYVFYALLIVYWVAFRLDESLKPEKRVPMKAATFAHGFGQVLRNKTTMIYLVCSGLVFGAFISYLGASQQIFMQQFSKSGLEFSTYFAVFAVVIGISSFINSHFVGRVGMRKICMISIAGLSLASILFFIAQIFIVATFWMFMLYMSIAFLCFGLVFGNLNAIALEPMGHIAGMATAIINTVSSILSLVLAWLIGQSYDGTLLPMTIGFMVLSTLALLLMRLEQKNQAQVDGLVGAS